MSAQIPDYRHITGQVKVYNPFHGWQKVIFDNHMIEDQCSQRYIGQSIPEIENILDNNGNQGIIEVPFPPEMISAFGNQGFIQSGLIPTLIVNGSTFYGILETVRNTILEWSLRLERDGILGDGMTFTQEEVQKASTVTYNIQNFSGVMGNVSSSQVQVGDYNSIHTELKRIGITQQERNKLENIIDELHKVSPEKKPALLKSGMEWVMRNATALGTLSETIRKWFE